MLRPFVCPSVRPSVRPFVASRPNELLVVQILTLIRFVFLCVYVAALCQRRFYTLCDRYGVLYDLVFALYYLCSPKF